MEDTATCPECGTDNKIVGIEETEGQEELGMCCSCQSDFEWVSPKGYVEAFAVE